MKGKDSHKVNFEKKRRHVKKRKEGKGQEERVRRKTCTSDANTSVGPVEPRLEPIRKGGVRRTGEETLGGQ